MVRTAAVAPYTMSSTKPGRRLLLALSRIVFALLLATFSLQVRRVKSLNPKSD